MAHHLLLAHAKVYRLYHQQYAQRYGDDDGSIMIGMANCGDFRYPRSSSSSSNNDDHDDAAADQGAAERAMLFQWGWFVDPLVHGDYPAVMRERLGDRLPTFSAAERDELQGSFDFLGLNYYLSLLATTPEQEPHWEGYWADINVDFRYANESGLLCSWAIHGLISCNPLF